MRLIVLAIVAHPDDAEFYAGATLAKMAAAGAVVYILVATDGRRGSYMEETADLAAQRSEEMRRAAAVLGAEPPILLGLPDMALDTLAPGTLRERFMREIRRLHPDIIFTHDPYALYEPHPDHRSVAWAATEAIAYAPLPLVFPEHLADGLAAHFVREKYFFGDTLPGANSVIDVSEFMERKLAAMGEHRSQVVFLVEGIVRQARLAGLDIAAVLPEAASPMALLSWGLRRAAAEVGRDAGFAYGEAFRYERFHPLIEEALVSSKRSEM